MREVTQSVSTVVLGSSRRTLEALIGSRRRAAPKSSRSTIRARSLPARLRASSDPRSRHSTWTIRRLAARQRTPRCFSSKTAVTGGQLLSMRLGSRTTAAPVARHAAPFAWREQSCERDRLGVKQQHATFGHALHPLPRGHLVPAAASLALRGKLASLARPLSSPQGVATPPSLRRRRDAVRWNRSDRHDNSERTVCRSAEHAWAVEGGLGAWAWRPGSDGTLRTRQLRAARAP